MADALVGVEAAAWLRAWAGISMEAKEGLLDSSERQYAKYVTRSRCCTATCIPGRQIDASKQGNVDVKNIKACWPTKTFPEKRRDGGDQATTKVDFTELRQTEVAI